MTSADPGSGLLGGCPVAAFITQYAAVWLVANADPTSTIEAYVAAYNAADVEAIVELFDENAVITNHPGGTFTGTEQIRSLHGEEADGTVSYTISNIEVSGNTVAWDHVWSGEEDNGEPFQNCVEGHTAIVENGQIVSWTWPPTDFQC